MAKIHKLTMAGEMVKRGFWLYVWRVHVGQKTWLYVGRTGDSSSSKSASPYSRMGQHLGSTKASNSLRRLLEEKGIVPEEDCKKHEIISYGPIFDEEEAFEEHKKSRDKVAALEKKLCDTLKISGYAVLNTVYAKKELDEKLWHEVRQAFAKEFKKLK